MQTAKRVEFDGKPVLVYREGAEVYAIGATCSHAGGPLNEGKFSRGCVECPWHQSVFYLQNGHVKHGPATHPQPGFEARIQNGKVQIRLCKDQECRKGNPEGNEYH
jgi:nitrite reductase/ring-hydroxylating ferredoxin subunit